jgi:hypothetical protein
MEAKLMSEVMVPWLQESTWWHLEVLLQQEGTDGQTDRQIDR